MAEKPDFYITTLHQLLEQMKLIVDLVSDGTITPDIYTSWMEGHWGLIWQIYAHIKERR